MIFVVIAACLFSFKIVTCLETDGNDLTTREILVVQE